MRALVLDNRQAGSRSRRALLNSSLNYYLLNLAVADLVIASFCTWVHAVDDASGTNWVLGPVICKLKRFMQSNERTVFSRRI